MPTNIYFTNDRFIRQKSMLLKEANLPFEGTLFAFIVHVAEVNHELFSTSLNRKAKKRATGFESCRLTVLYLRVENLLLDY